MPKPRASIITTEDKQAALNELKQLQQSSYKEIESIYNNIITDPIYDKELFKKYSGPINGPEDIKKMVDAWMNAKDEEKFNFNERTQEWEYKKVRPNGRDAWTPSEGLPHMVFLKNLITIIKHDVKNEILRIELRERKDIINNIMKKDQELLKIEDEDSLSKEAEKRGLKLEDPKNYTNIKLYTGNLKIKW